MGVRCSPLFEWCYDFHDRNVTLEPIRAIDPAFIHCKRVFDFDEFPYLVKIRRRL